MTAPATSSAPLMPQEHPHLAGAVDRQSRILEQGRVQVLGRSPGDCLAGLAPLAIRKDCNPRAASRARVVQSRALLEVDAVLGILIAIVLAPVRRAFLPGDPYAVGGIHGHVRLHFRERTGRDLDRFPDTIGGNFAQQQVVPHFAVRIPSHPRVTRCINGYRWLPIVLGGLGQVRCFAPRVAIEPAQHNVALGRAAGRRVPVPGPHHVEAPVRRRGHIVKRIRPRILAQANRRRPCSAIPVLGEDIEVPGA